ncbi:MAG TPA: hypothetical protein VGA45_11620, partial [Actinomycetota bacterium]
SPRGSRAWAAPRPRCAAPSGRSARPWGRPRDPGRVAMAEADRRHGGRITKRYLTELRVAHATG